MNPSLSSHASVRSLIVACLPATALGVIANSPALGAVFNPPADQGLTTDDNVGTNAASPHAPSTNSGAGTNTDAIQAWNGIRS